MRDIPERLILEICLLPAKVTQMTWSTATDPKQPIKKLVAAEGSKFPIELENEKRVGPKYRDGLLTRRKAFSVQSPKTRVPAV